METAYHQGKEDYYANHSLGDCPFVRTWKKEWERGWWDAFEEDFLGFESEDSNAA